MKQSVLWLTLAAALSPKTAAAQQSVLEAPGLRAYVAEVLTKNAGYHAAATQLRAAARRIAPAGALPDPMVSAGAMSVPAPSFDLGAEDMTQVPTIMLQQHFPFPGKQGAQTAVARADSALADAGYQAVEAALVAAAARAYYTLAYARSALEVWRGRTDLANQAIAISQVRYETGAAAQTDLLRARLRRAELEEERRRLEAELTAAAAHVDALRAGPGDSVATPRLAARPVSELFQLYTEPVPPDSPLSQQLTMRNPALRAGAAEVERAARTERVFAIAARPDFTIGVQSGFRTQGREPFLTAQVGVSVPLWASRKQSPAAAAARLEADASRQRYDDLVTRLTGALRAVNAVIAALQDRIRQTAGEILLLAEAASLSALQRYQVGQLEFTAVLQAQDDLFRAQLMLARLIADYGTARAELASLVGEEWYR
jgi:outer membrane protein TolC